MSELFSGPVKQAYDAAIKLLQTTCAAQRVFSPMGEQLMGVEYSWRSAAEDLPDRLREATEAIGPLVDDFKIASKGIASVKTQDGKDETAVSAHELILKIARRTLLIYRGAEEHPGLGREPPDLAKRREKIDEVDSLDLSGVDWQAATTWLRLALVLANGEQGKLADLLEKEAIDCHVKPPGGEKVYLGIEVAGTLVYREKDKVDFGSSRPPLNLFVRIVNSLSDGKAREQLMKELWDTPKTENALDQLKGKANTIIEPLGIEISADARGVWRIKELSS